MKRLFLLPLAALAGCTHLFFQPSRAVFADPAASGLRYEVLKFPSLDGTELTALFFPPPAAPRGTVVYLHGNAQNMTAHYPYAAWLAAEGYNVLVPDYRGYGASSGRSSLDGAVLDARAALAQALKLPGADPGRVIVFGQSLGGALAVAALAESGFKPAAFFVEGTFYSYRGVAAYTLRRHWLTWPLSWLAPLLVSGRHSPGDLIGKIDSPKLFIHSEGDRKVPFSQGRKLYEAAAGPKEFWTVPGGHIEAFDRYRAEYASRLLDYLRRQLPD